MPSKLGNVIADFTTQLATQGSIGATSFILQSVLDDDGNALPSGPIFFTLDGSNGQKEHVFGTLNASTLTLSSIYSVSRQGVQTSGLARLHRVGASVVITDFGTIDYINRLLMGVDSFDSGTKLGYNADPGLLSSDLYKFATVNYANSLAIAGAPNAATGVKGIGYISVAPVSAGSPIFVGQNDPILPTQNQTNALAGQSGTGLSTSNKVEDYNDTSNVSATGKLARMNAGGTLDPSIIGNSPFLQSMIAAATITQNQAVYVTGYQTDGGVKFDSSNGYYSASTVTNPSFTLTVGNHTNRVVLVGVAGACTGVTFNGAAMTQIDSNSTGNTSSLWYILAPAVGSGSVVVQQTSFTGAIQATSYYNVAQTGTIDAHGFAEAGSTTVTKAITTVVAGALVVSFGALFDNSVTPTGGTFTNAPNNANGTQAGAWGCYAAFADSGAQFIPGSYSNTVTQTGGAGTPSTTLFEVSLTPVTLAVAAVSPTSASVAGTANAFMGFAVAAIAAGVAGNIQISSIMSGFSGLIPGVQYYLSNTAGAISSTVGTVTRKVGIAISSTTLLITNIW